jgi:hypothetical protein
MYYTPNLYIITMHTAVTIQKCQIILRKLQAKVKKTSQTIKAPVEMKEYATICVGNFFLVVAFNRVDIYVNRLRCATRCTCSDVHERSKATKR